MKDSIVSILSLVLILVTIFGLTILAVTPAWSETGVVMSNASQFSGNSWQHVVVIHSASHGDFTLSSVQTATSCSSTNIAYLYVNETVGIWANHFGCVFVVERA